MMAMMGKPFIGDIPDALSINLFDIVNYPNLSYGNGAFVDMAFQSTINRQFLLDYVYLSAPYDSVNALYTTMLLARKEALNGTNILPSPNPNK